MTDIQESPQLLSPSEVTKLIISQTSLRNDTELWKIVTSVPTHTPKSKQEQIVLYQSGGISRLYWYDTTNNSWRVFTSDHGELSGLSDDDHPQYSINQFTATAGESITAGRFVCYKTVKDSVTTELSEDTYADELNPTTDYSASSYNYAGIRDVAGAQYEQWAYLKFATPPSSFSYPSSVTLKIDIAQRSAPTGYPNFGIYWITGSWSEGTLNWNNKPTLGDLITPYNFTDTSTVSIDITQKVRKLLVDGTTVTGICIKPYYTGGQPDVTSNSWAYVNVSNASADTQIDYVEYGNDTKVYLADPNYYNLSSRIVGYATESASTDAEVTIKTPIGIGTFSSLTEGRPYFLSTSGISSSEEDPIDETVRTIEVGHSVSSTQLALNLKKVEPFFIESYTFTLDAGDASSTYYPAPRFTKILVKYSGYPSNIGGTHTGQFWVYRTDSGYGNNGLTMTFDGASSGDVWSIYTNISGADNTITTTITSDATKSNFSIIYYLFE